jgi:hypothetical protein
MTAGRWEPPCTTGSGLSFSSDATAGESLMGTLGRSAGMYSSVDGTPTCPPEFTKVVPARDARRPNDA